MKTRTPTLQCSLGSGQWHFTDFISIKAF